MHDEGGEAGGSCGQQPLDPSEAGQLDNNHHSGHVCGGAHKESSAPYAHFRSRRNRRPNGISVACQTDTTEEYPREASLLTPKVDTSTQAEASSSSEGVLRLMIQNFPNMNDTVRGPSKNINGVQWRIMVMPRQHVVQKEGDAKMLGLFSAMLSGCLFGHMAMSSGGGTAAYIAEAWPKENDWGYSCFMTWADILDESQGYIKDDRVVLEVSVKADAPKNILTKEEFQKQIHSWYELAVLQHQRGCIDLALEANAQALKFCKDRDAAIKDKLETQKKFLVDQKVVESIQRIEKKDQRGGSEDDNNPTAVRLAITQSSAPKVPAAKGKNGKKGAGGATAKKKNTRASTPPGSPPSEEKKEANGHQNGLDGRFSKQLYHRGGMKEDSLIHLAKQIYELPVDAIPLDEENTKEHLHMMIDQFLRSSKTNTGPLDMELQRQHIIRKAISFVEEYEEKVAEGKDLVSTDLDSTLPQYELDIAELWKPTFDARVEERLQVIEDNMMWLDAKVRLFWVSVKRLMEMDEDDSYTDGSCSSDTDSGSVPKKCDSECQTEPDCEMVVLHQLEQDKKNSTGETVPVPTVRVPAPPRTQRPMKTVAKKSTAVSGKAAANAQVINQQLQQMQQQQMNQAPLVPQTQSVQQTMQPMVNDLVDPNHLIQGLVGYIDGMTAAQMVLNGSPSAPPPMEFAMRLHQEPLDQFQSAMPQLQPQTYLNEQTMAHQQQQQQHQQAQQPGHPMAMGQYMQPPPGFDQERYHQDVAAGFWPPSPFLHYTARQKPRRPQQSATAELTPEELNPATQDYITHAFARIWSTMAGRGDDVAVAQQFTQIDPNAPMLPYEQYVGGYQNGVYPNAAAQQQHQIHLALSVMAMCCVNAKKAEEKLSAITQHIDQNVRNPDVQNALRSLCKLGDMVVVEEEEEIETPIHDEKDSGEDYLLNRHVARLENLQQKAEKYSYYIHSKDREKLSQAVSAVETKFEKLDKEKARLQKLSDESKREADKSEKNLTKTLGELRSEKEIKDKLNNQLKEKNKEIKKLEKRVKELTAQAEEKDELREQKDALYKDLQAEKKKYQEAENRVKRETAAKEELKRHLADETRSKESENSRLSQANEDLKSQLKKAEQTAASEKQKATAAHNQALERAKKVEIQFVELVYEVGTKKLEQAKEEASKNMREMEDAAANRARNAQEQQLYAASKDEWKAKVDDIQKLLNQAKTEFNAQHEALKKGRPLSELPKFHVPAPPPPCKVVQIQPLVPASVVLPPENRAGVIGHRTGASQLPTPIGTSISPQNKAPGSPVQKPVATVASQPQTSSPSRHDFAGTPISTCRIANGGEAAGVGPATNCTNAPGTGALPTWSHWNDFNLTDSLFPTGNRTFGSLTSDFASTPASSNSSSGQNHTTTNGWPDESGWGANKPAPAAPAPGAHNTYMRGVSPSFAGGNVWDSSRAAPPTSAPNPTPPAHNTAQGPNAQVRYQTIIARLVEFFNGFEQAKLVDLANQYCIENKTNLQNESLEGAVAILKDFILKKVRANGMQPTSQMQMPPNRRIQPPPGVSNAAYMGMAGGMPQLDISARPNPLGYPPLIEPPHLLNGDASRNILQNEKWNLS
ncbi:unnamed protein product, partial [Mesorhabditis spiculigera]